MISGAVDAPEIVDEADVFRAVMYVSNGAIGPIDREL